MISWRYFTQFSPTNQIPQSGLNIEISYDKKVANFLFLLSLPSSPENIATVSDLLNIPNSAERLVQIRQTLSPYYDGVIWDSAQYSILQTILTQDTYFPVGLFELDLEGILRPTLTDVKEVGDYYSDLPCPVLHWFEYAITQTPLLFYAQSLSKPSLLLRNTKQRCNSQF